MSIWVSFPFLSMKVADFISPFLVTVYFNPEGITILGLFPGLINDFAPFFNASTTSFSVSFILTILFFKGTTSNTCLESTGPASKKPRTFPTLIRAKSVSNSCLTASIIKYAFGLGSISLFFVGPGADLISPKCSGLPKIWSNTPFKTLLRLKSWELITLFWTFIIVPFSLFQVSFKSPKYSPSFPPWVIITGSFDFE